MAVDFGVFERAKSLYYEGNAKFVPADEETYEYALGVLPPAAYNKHGFLMGEPYSHNAKGEAVYFAFLAYPNGVFACGLMTEAIFKNMA